MFFLIDEQKQKIKRGLKFAVIIFISFAVLVLILSNLYSYLEKKKQEKLIKELQKPYLEDTYGGKTPEETLELFIQALKEGNIDLASKYFIIEKQEEWRDLLNEINKGNDIDQFISELELPKEKEEMEPLVGFVIRNKNGTSKYSIRLIKYLSNVWKITEI